MDKAMCLQFWMFIPGVTEIDDFINNCYFEIQDGPAATLDLPKC